MIIDRINQDLKNSLKEKKADEVSALRFLLAAVKDKEIELNKRGQISDEEVVAVIRKQVKQRKESIASFQKAGRNDLADKEEKELKLLSKYLHREMKVEEIETVVQKVVDEIGADGSGDFGKVMGKAMVDLKGKAGGKVVAEVVKKALA